MRASIILATAVELWKSGGFTIGLNYQADHKRYVVSLAGFEAKFVKRPTDDETASYVREHWAELRKPERYLGGCHDGAAHFLDVSTSFEDRAEALAFARENRQVAIFDSATGEAVLTFVDQAPIERLVIASGDPFNGMVLVGPFESAEDASSYAENERNIRNAPWEIVALQAPADAS